MSALFGEGGMFAVANYVKIRPSADAINFGVCGRVFETECCGGGSF
jgi:hypothetical protein